MRTWGFVLVALALTACASPPPSRSVEVVATPSTAQDALAAPIAPKPLPPQSLSRWIASDGFIKLSESRSGAVVNGRRILRHQQQATVIDRDPINDLGRAHQIPKALGGGWLFLGTHSGRFASSFDGALTTIFSSPKGGTRLRVGIGRKQILVTAQPSAPVLYALPSGAVTPLPVKGTVELFGTPQGLVALRTEQGALHSSVSANAPWKRLLKSSVEGLAYDGKGIVVRSKSGDTRLGFDGRLSPRPQEPGFVVSDNVSAFMQPWPDFAQPPPRRPAVDSLLEPLVSLMTDEIALRVEGADLFLLDARTGKVVEKKADYFRGHENCFPIRGGSPAFVGCNGKSEMALFRIDGPEGKPTVERKFRGVYTQDFGGPPADAPLALAKRCDGSVRPGTLCVRSKDGKWKELPRPKDPKGLLARVPMFVHVAAASGGFAYAFGWLGGGGDLVILDAKAKSVRRVAKARFPKWAADGIRWDALNIDEGTLRFLIATGGPGVLEILPDDTVRAKRLRGRMAASGSRALLIAPEGTVQETLDAGKSFHGILPPPGGAPQKGLARCVATGCSLGPWHRVGWGPD